MNSTSIKIFASALGRKVGVGVKFVQATTASTDGESIFLPVGVSDPELVFGFVAHEAAHLRFTHFGAWGEARGAFIKAALNVFEDIRIEKEIILEYPGTSEMLEALSRRYDVGCGAQAGGKPLAQLALGFAQMDGRHRHLGQPMGEDAAAFAAEIAARFGDELVEKIREIVDRIRIAPQGASGTKFCLALAERLYALLQEAKHPDPPQAPQPSQGEKGQGGEGEESSDSSSSQKEGEEEGTPNTAQGGEGESTQDEATQGGPSSEEQPSGQADQGEELDADVNPDDWDRGVKVKADLSADAKNAQFDLVTLYEHTGITVRKGDFMWSNLPASDEAVQTAKRWRAKVAPLFLGEKAGQQAAKSGARMDMKALHKAVAMPHPEREKPFLRHAPQKSIRALVGVLVDVSGSMYKQRTELNNAIDAILMGSWGVTGLRLAVSCFDDKYYRLVEAGNLPKVGQGKSVIVSGWGGTLTYPSVFTMMGDLLSAQQRGEQVVLFVVTDGEPAGGDEELKAFGKLTQAAPFPIIGIGLGGEVKAKASAFVTAFGEGRMLFADSVTEMPDRIAEMLPQCLAQRPAR